MHDPQPAVVLDDLADRARLLLEKPVDQPGSAGAQAGDTLILLQKARCRGLQSRRLQRRGEAAGLGLLLERFGRIAQLILGLARGLVLEQDVAGADLFFAILLEPLLNLDQVPAEARLHRFGHLARLQRESRIGKGRDHPLAAEGPQVAAVDRRALVVGDHLGQFGEVGTSQDLLAQAAYFLGNFERIPSAGGLGKEHVLEANLGGMLVLGEVLLVVGGHVGVGDLDRVVGRSATRGKHVFDRHLLVGLVEVLPRLARAHLYHTG